MKKFSKLYSVLLIYLFFAQGIVCPRRSYSYGAPSAAPAFPMPSAGFGLSDQLRNTFAGSVKGFTHNVAK